MTPSGHIRCIYTVLANPKYEACSEIAKCMNCLVASMLLYCCAGNIRDSNSLSYCVWVKLCIYRTHRPYGSICTTSTTTTLQPDLSGADVQLRKVFGTPPDFAIASHISPLQGDVLQATSTLVGQLVQGRVEDLNAVDIGLTAWSLGTLVDLDSSVRSSEMRQLIDVLAVHAVSSNVMEQQADEACRHWARLLKGLADIGVKCHESQAVSACFSAAITERMPVLIKAKQVCEPQSVSNAFHATVQVSFKTLAPFVSAVADDVDRVMEGSNAQDWSNLLWACAKQDESGSGQLGQGMPVILRGAAPAMASLAMCGSVVPQDLSNVLWAFARFSWYDASAVGELASAIAKQARGNLTTDQNLANTLWALSKLGWYDVSVYSKLTSAFVQNFNDAKSQGLSNVLLGCAEARHWDSSMEGLAEFVSKQSEQQWGKWNGQDLANSLYAWAVLTAAGPNAASASPSFKSMAQQLFSQVSKRGPSAFIDLELSQLFVAHQVAVYRKLPGDSLYADAQLLEKVVAADKAYMNELQRMVKGGEINEVAAALQRVGYEVEVAQVVQNGGLKRRVPLLAQGVAVRVMFVDAYFRSPPDLLSGSKQIHVVLAGWVCGSSIVIPEAEWAGMQGDTQQQQAYVVRRMHEALKS